VIASSPKKFAEWFNEKYIGVYRQIATEDVKDMTDCGLIHHRGYYSGSQDGETIKAVLQYEKLREHRSAEQEKEKNPPPCKICGQPLPPNPEGKAGRHKEYCSGCERYRIKDRQKRLRHRRRK
jgi:hypothetical protein